jgi:hypothetical protein
MTPADSKSTFVNLTNAVGLAHVLAAIEAIDPSVPGAEQVDTDQRYLVRNGLIYNALSVATRYGYPCGFAIDLPNGQVSWHLPAYPGQWDGHDAIAKSTRIRAYVERARS